MRHQNRRWKVRARDASAEDTFTRALLGEESSDSRSFDARTDRKTMQLCRQIHRALIMAVGEELPGNISVESVEPLGGAAQLLVRIVVNESTASEFAAVSEQLNQRAGAVRGLISRSICRKRTPSLHFVAVPSAADGGNGGQP